MTDRETELRKQLQSDDVDEVHDALIDIGKEGLYSLTDDVARLLDDGRGAVRAAAIRVLALYWQLPASKATAERMSRTDSDVEVRVVALMAWSAYYDGTRDRSVLRLLDQLLRDPAAPEELRAQAYLSILAVSDLPKSEWPSTAAVFGEIEGTVDWNLIDRLMADALR